MDIRFKKMTRNVFVKTAVFLICLASLCFSVIPFMELIPKADAVSMTLEDMKKGDYLTSDSCFRYKERAVEQYLLAILDYRTTDNILGSGRTYTEHQIASWKSNLNQMEGIQYFAQAGDLIVKNIDAETPEEFDFFGRQSYLVLDNTTNTYDYSPRNHDADYAVGELIDFSSREISNAETLPDRSQYRIYVSLDDAFIAKRQVVFQSLCNEIPRQIGISSVLLGIALLCIIYLCTFCGKKPEDEAIHPMLIDRVWSEIMLAFLIIWPILIAGGAISIFMEAYRSQFMDLVKLPLEMGIVLAAALWIAVLCSIVRNLKAHRFFGRFAVVQFIRWFTRFWKNTFQGVFVGISKVGTLRFRIFWCLALLAVIHVFAGLFLCTGFLFGFVIWGIGVGALDIFILKRIGTKANQFEKIAFGIEQVRTGNLNHKIEVPESGILRDMALNANGIAEGLSRSVQKEVKAERLKAELITNVSHDLKTPLTAIINYTELLGKETLSPEVANDYVKVIRKKSEKLKSLTQDLFDISKAQSGNIEVSLECLDLAELVRQSAGEAEERMKQAGLDCRVNVQCESAMIMADGRLLSRAVENLIGNIIKYTLQGTRVYIDVMCQNNRVSAQFKNNANYEMNFSADEITERFTRGDEARTTEGSGLGLAIAKSYIEACGGRMVISVDGDLFKATLGFEAAK